MITDAHGLPLTGASPAAADSYGRALHAYHCYDGDVMGHIDAALADSPRFVMTLALKAYLHLMGTNSRAMRAGEGIHAVLRDLPTDDREAGHVAAVGHLVAGRTRAAARVLEDLSIAWPRDILALQVGQTLDFMGGDSRMLRDRVGRALPAWSPEMPAYHAIQGLMAFGLEETALYDRAEAAGRLALELEPRNGWARHAVAHVMEMQDRRGEGIAFMRAGAADWTGEESFFRIHNWWHLSLFHLGLGQTAEALAIYDEAVFGAGSTLAFDLVDGAALLWRLNLQGAEVGDRWAALADVYETEPRGGYAFDDAHAMLAFASAGRDAAAQALLEAQDRATGDNASVVREVGLPIILGMQAFARGRHAEAVEHLRQVRGRAGGFGGSHAQRDLIDLTLIEAARRGGMDGLWRALLAEREAARPPPPS